MSLENPPPIESGEGTDTLGLEGILQRAEDADARMRTDETHTAALFERIVPQNPEQEALLASLKERHAELPASREDLKNVANAAALDTVLKSATAEGAEGTVNAEQLAQVLANNPDLAQMILGALLNATQQGEKPHLDAGKMHELSDHVKEIVDEMDAADKKIFKGLALRTAERIARAVLSAATLGLGGIVYDTAKDAYASMKVRKQIREKRKALQVSSEMALAA